MEPRGAVLVEGAGLGGGIVSGGEVLSGGGRCCPVGGRCCLGWDVLSWGEVLSITGSDITAPPFPFPMDRQTGVKSLLSRNFVCES